MPDKKKLNVKEKQVKNPAENQSPVCFLNSPDIQEAYKYPAPTKPSKKS